MGKSIGIVSLKGGVGKTSVTVSLGHAISSFGKKVLLVDANFSAPNLGLHLDIIEPEKTLHDVMERKVNPSSAVHKLNNFDVLPASIFSDANISPLSLKNRINHLKRSYDIILIDSSPSLGDETLGAILASDELIVVTTPDAPTLGMTLKAVKFARKRGTPISGLVLNKVHGKNFEVTIKDVENTIEIPVMAVVPHDINVLRALSKFKPSTEFKPKSESSEEYKKLASVLIGEKYKPVKLKNFFRWVNPRKQDVNRTIFYENLFE